MRIVSETKDYYDCMQAEGQDQSLLYVRTAKRIHGTQHFPFFYLHYAGEIYLRHHVVGFCGKLYSVFQFLFPSRIPPREIVLDTPAKKIGLTTCFNLEEVDGFMKKHLRKVDYESYMKKRKLWYWTTRWSLNVNHHDFVRYFEEFEKQYRQSTAFTKYFEEYRAPVFIASTHNGAAVDGKREVRLVINGLLRDLDFARLFDPYRAFQEIAMFWGNMAVPIKPIPEIDDKTLAEAKGFTKYSFRKDKSTKKRR